MISQNKKMKRLLTNWQNEIQTQCSNYIGSFSDDVITDSYDFCNAILNTFVDASCASPSSINNNNKNHEPAANNLCCQSLQANYNGFCKDTNVWTDSHLLALTLIFLLCGMVSSFIEKFKIHWMPEAGACILVGVLCGIAIQFLPGIQISDISFDQDFFIFVLIPPIIFDAALTVDKSEFMHRFVPITLLAVFGTMISSILTGIMVHYASFLILPSLTIPLLDSLVFGALISSIDPVAILSVLTNLNMGQSDTIFILVFGESLLNDGIAITMFNAFVRQYKSGLDFGVTMVMWVIFTSLIICIGSMVVAIAFGFISLQYFKVLHGSMSPVSEVISFFLWALVPYYTSDAMGLSGIVTLVFMGFFMDIFITSGDSEYRRILRRIKAPVIPVNNAPERNLNYINSWDTIESERNSFLKKLSHLSPVALSQEADIHIRFVSHVFARIFENAIFVYLGLFLLSDRYDWNLHLISVSIFSCLLSRAIMVLVVSRLLWVGYTLFFRNKCNGVTSDEGSILRGTVDSLMSLKTLVVMVLAGLRGAVSLALVESIPTYDAVTGIGSTYKPEIKAMTCSTIIFTIYFLGGSAFYVLRSLNIQGQTQLNTALEVKLMESPRNRLNSVT